MEVEMESLTAESPWCLGALCFPVRVVASIASSSMCVCVCVCGSRDRYGHPGINTTQYFFPCLTSSGRYTHSMPFLSTAAGLLAAASPCPPGHSHSWASNRPLSQRLQSGKGYLVLLPQGWPPKQQLLGMPHFLPSCCVFLVPQPIIPPFAGVSLAPTGSGIA